MAAYVPGFNRKKILKSWDLFKSTLAFETFFKPHDVVLLKDVKYGFDDTVLQVAATQFVGALRQTELQLIKEAVDVTQYAPLSKIATSIQY